MQVRSLKDLWLCSKDGMGLMRDQFPTQVGYWNQFHVKTQNGLLLGGLR